jgi:putative PEP-CTERM system TPR-repeat lipoprotein
MMRNRFVIVLIAACSLAACNLWKSPDEQVAQARKQFAAGQYRSAMADVKTALESEPEHAQARLLLAEISLWLGDPDAAEGELKRAIGAGLPAQDGSELHYKLLLARSKYDEILAELRNEHGMAPARVLLYEARAHQGRDETDAARQALQKALQLTPEDPELQLQAAEMAAASGELRRALEVTERVTRPPEMKARALYLRGQIFRSRGEPAQARDALAGAYEIGRRYLPVPEQFAVLVALAETQLALADAAGTNKTLEQLALWAPNSVAYYYLRARVALLKNDPVTAVAECQRALRVNPDHKPSEMLLAVAHLSHGSFEQAQGVLERVLSADPGNVAASKLLAQVHLGRNEPEQARRVLDAIPGGSQGDPQVDWLMGSALLQSGDAAGLAALERSQAAAPDDVGRRLDLANAYLIAGVPHKAIELLKAVPPGSPQSGRAQALRVLASVSGKAPAEARDAIDKLVAADDRNVDLLTAAGVQLAASGETEVSKQWLQRALDLDPKAVYARWGLAQLAVRAQDLARADKLLREILAIEPTQPRPYVGLAELAWRKGDREQTQKWLEQAISANPAAVEPRLRLAQLAFVAGDAARGKDLLAQAIRISGADRGSVLNSAGQVLARAGFAEEALDRFKEAAAAGAQQGVLNAERLLQEAGRNDEARKMLEAALVDRPDWREPARRLLELDARNGRADEALARVRAMSQLPPVTALEYQGDINRWAKRYPAALAAYEAAYSKQPSAALVLQIFNVRQASGESAPERSLIEWLRKNPADAQMRRILAAHYQAAGRVDEAVGEYEKLLAAGRIDPVSLNNLAWILHARRDARAASLAKRAHDAAPQVAEIADTYGWILVQTDKIDEGIGVLERALAGAPANPDIQYHVAAAYVKSGQSARGAQLLRELLRKHETFASRRDAEQLMQSLSDTSGAGPQGAGRRGNSGS